MAKNVRVKLDRKGMGAFLRTARDHLKLLQ